MVRLFLDDVREPIDCVDYMYKRVGKDNLQYSKEWNIVRTFNEFKDFVYTHPDIDVISLDYDLNEHPDWEKGISGCDCLVFLMRFYRIKRTPLPKIQFHTTNPQGLMHLKLIMDLYKTYKNDVIVYPTLDDIDNYMDYYDSTKDEFDVDDLKHFTSR